MSTSTAQAFWPALDLERVRAAITPHLVSGRRVHNVVVQDVRYRPLGVTWLLYRVDVPEATSGPSYLAARLLADGEAVRAPEPSLVYRYRAWPDRIFQEPWFVDRDLSLEFYAFPADPGLPLLFEAADAAHMKSRLACFVPQARIQSVLCRNRSYLPHSRATFAYEVRAENGSAISLSLVGKMHSGKAASDRFARHQALWSLAGDRLSIPRPLGAVEEAGVALQEHVTGERLGALVDLPTFEDLARQTARELAVLHQLHPSLVKERRPIDEARQVSRWSELLRALRPDLAPRLVALEQRLTRDILQNDSPTALIHADFHHTNVLVDGDRLTFIDLDEMAVGDPMVDVGRFMASLRIPALRVFGRADALNGAADAFLEEYLRQTGHRSSRARLFEAASLLIAAGSAFRLQREHWRQEIEVLLESSEKISRDARGDHVNPTVVAPAQSEQDASIPHVLRDLHQSLASRARGKSMIVGPEAELLAQTLTSRGSPVVTVPGVEELRQTSEPATTVLVWNLLERLDEASGKDLLRTAWARVRPGGRLIVTVPNIGAADANQRRFSRRRLRHELRELGRPELATDQPYRWLVMIVRKPGGRPPTLSRTNRQRARVTVKVCQGNVIDLGCGEGHLAGLIAESGHRVTGIDKNRNKIQIAKRLYPGVTFLAGDIRKTDLPQEHFDTALLAEVIEHLTEDESREALQAAMRLVKPGGRLVVSVPNEDCVPHRNHLQEFDRRSLRRLLEPFGKTKLVTEQPYKWLLMVVEKP